MPRELAFIDGALGGVNTMLNVAGFKENQKDRSANRARQLKLDTHYEEDRKTAAEEREFNRERITRQDEQNAAANEQNRILGAINIRNAQGVERQRVLSESYNLLRGFNGFVDGQEVDEPAVMGALNYFLQERINNDPNARKTISDITPAPNGQGVMVELNVEPNEGEPYRAPLTRNRSSDPADPVVIVPYDDLFSLVNEVADDLQEAGFQGTMPEITQQLEEFLRVASGDRTAETADAELAKEDRAHGRTLELKVEDSRLRREEAEHEAALGDSDNPTIRTIEYLRQNLAGADGEPISVEQAIEINNWAKSDPAAAVLRVYEQLSDAQANSITPGSDQVPISEEDLMNNARQMVQGLLDEVKPTRGVSSRELSLPAASSAGASRLAGEPEQTVVPELPDPAMYPAGTRATNDETGEVYESNGTEWVRVQ